MKNRMKTLSHFLVEKKISKELAKSIGDDLGVNWKKVDLEQFHMGLRVEQEHEDVTHGNLTLTAKIALAHLKELPDYYTRLAKMEKGK